ncbi:Na+/H+ antiporter subunit C [Geoalkalibacter sp.]|uniref:Na+/H+ antiporter subunit C n=1 Tax=Geoalkalibacter sp. TaxID=3041440 RepID=UPI00272E0CF1|nr:Na+/H+ antiporter subunit C [Geoalkalibacter sp.]
METLLAIVVGVLFGAGVYLLLRRTPVKLVIGLALLSNAVNLLIFTAAGLTRARPPLVPVDALRPEGVTADPLPQALILTAIVISFGLLAFTLVLFRRAYEVLGTRDIDEMQGGGP